MSKLTVKIIGTLSLMALFLTFQTPTTLAKDLQLITFTQAEQQNEIVITQDSVITAELGLVIPKLIIEDGVEIVEINADIQTLEIRSHNTVELVGKGNISTITISSDSEVAINTTGNIQKIEVLKKDTRLVISEGTKIAELLLPKGTSATEIITNYDQAITRFENINVDTTEEPVYIPEPLPEPVPTPEPTPEDDFNFSGNEGNSSFNVDLLRNEISTVGTITSGVSNIFIQLDAGEIDVDLEIWEESDADSQIPVLVYGNSESFQGDSENQVTWVYNGLQFTYSGWYGVDNQYGKEWITIEGTTDRDYTIKVKNYGPDTNASVDYSWGNEGEASTWVIDKEEITLSPEEEVELPI